MDNFWESSSDSEFCILEVLKRCCGHCSIFVYLYLLRDFSPFTTTPVLVPLLLHNRKRSSVLVGFKGLRFLTLFYTSCSSLEELLCIAMFWLDRSSTLPFPIVSTSCLRKPCVEHLAEALVSIENQAKIAKSWVEIGDFNHWCHAASELVDLTNHLVYMENSLLYYEGLISKNERLHCCSKLNSQLMDLVSFSTFERARERLLVNFKLVPLPEPSITTLSPLHDQSVNWRPSSDSAEMGTQVTTMSFVLPRHPIATSTPPSHTPSNALQVNTTPTDVKKARATATMLPHHRTLAVQTALAI